MERPSQSQIEDDILVPAPEGKGWVVMHVRPRCEKKLVDYCRANHIRTYLPLHERTHNYGNRVRTFQVPLFSAYVFGVAARDEFLHLQQNRFVANILEVVEQEKLLKQLISVRDAISSGEAIEVLPFLEQGRPVLLTAGPLKGCEGIVVSLKGQARVIINVDMIGQSIAIEVDSTCLSPL